MDPSPISMAQIASTSIKLVQRLMPFSASRVELLILETQEAGNRLLRLFIFTVALGVCGLLALMALTALIIVIFWAKAPVLTLVVVVSFYLLAFLLLLRRILVLSRHLDAFSATLSQLRKDKLAFEQFAK